MGSRLLLSIIGLTLVSSMLLVPSFEQVFAYSALTTPNRYESKPPPIGSVYVVNLSGSAHLLTKGVTIPVSAQLTLNVTKVTTVNANCSDCIYKSVSTVYLKLVSGDLKVGNAKFSLTSGSSTIIYTNTKIKVSSSDGSITLTIFGSLTGSLPQSKSGKPVGLVHASGEKSADIKIKLDDWFLDRFGGNISKIA